MKNIILQFVLFIISVCVINAQTDKITKINSNKIENAAERTQTSAGKVNGSNSTQATNTVLYDFTTGSDKYYGGAAAAVEVEPGVWAMIAGDANGDGGIYAQDYSNYKTNQGNEGYYNADFNMDGGVYAQDYTLYKANQGKETLVP
ncbi:MAG: hypothetical protein IPK06_11825 [Ignavibacteriae bacterium]|nr:hypothetical protein [Ignavibacteriota bacterium]